MVKISLITATLNSGKTLGHCLQSVKQQRIPIEHIIVDGGSTDDTLAIARQHNDQLACILPGPDKGIYDGMNRGITHASGDVIGILNSDDFYPSTTVLSQVAAAFSDPEVEAIYGDLQYVDCKNHGRIVRYWRAGEYRSPRQFYWGWMVPHPTIFLRKSLYERYGLFNLELGSAADYEFMLRLFVNHRISLHYIPKVLVHMRTGGASNANLGNRLKANGMDRKAWQVNGLCPYPWTVWLKPLRKIGQWVVRRNYQSEEDGG